MSKNQDDKLEVLLRQRRAESASADLADRIILRAQSLPQVQNISLWNSVRQIFAEFHLPKPAYVLATTLLLGVILGFTTAPDDGPNGDSGSFAAQSYIAADEGLL